MSFSAIDRELRLAHLELQQSLLYNARARASFSSLRLIILLHHRRHFLWAPYYIRSADCQSYSQAGQTNDLLQFVRVNITSSHKAIFCAIETEKDKYLKHRRYHRIIVVSVIFFHSRAADPDSPLWRLIETAYKLNKGGFPRAVASHDCYFFAFVYFERHAFQNTLIGFRVNKAHVFKFDINCRIGDIRAFFSVRFVRHIQKFAQVAYG